MILNEVLSLNAQESCARGVVTADVVLLNEVLSLNAQELRTPAGASLRSSSSMKS